MNAYGALASWYDGLTGDVSYDQFADLYEAEFARAGGGFRLILDLCCGTGTLTKIMAERGYEMIGADASVDMLMQAREKCASLAEQPLFLLQKAEDLDLYGTVDAAFSSLDAINYIPQSSIPEVFRRLGLFIRPGGLLLFDIRSPQWMRGLDGQSFWDEREDLICLWRAQFDREENALVYGLDLFEREGALWRRSREEHVEYAHEPEMLSALMAASGFCKIRVLSDGPQSDSGRLFLCAVHA